MPGKLKFHIVHCSSEDEHHPITEWYVHNPNSRGWQTPKGYAFCKAIFSFSDNIITLLYDLTKKKKKKESLCVIFLSYK